MCDLASMKAMLFTSFHGGLKVFPKNPSNLDVSPTCKHIQTFQMTSSHAHGTQTYYECIQHDMQEHARTCTDRINRYVVMLIHKHRRL